jgi:phage terminase small subunit
MNASEAYRASYNTKAKASTVNVEAHKLMKNPKVANTIEALERAKEASALHSIESLKALVISTLTDIATNSDKDAVRVHAVKTLGTVVGVDMFRETKRIETVKDSDEIKSQIMQQLKAMMIGADNAVTVDANDLLSELAGDANLATSRPTAPPPCHFDNGTPTLDEHTIPLEQSVEFLDPLEQSQDILEDPPLPLELPTPQGDIFLEKGK